MTSYKSHDDDSEDSLFFELGIKIFILHAAPVAIGGFKTPTKCDNFYLLGDNEERPSVRQFLLFTEFTQSVRIIL